MSQATCSVTNWLQPLYQQERAIRPYVIWRKTSFFSQSARGHYSTTTTKSARYIGVSPRERLPYETLKDKEAPIVIINSKGIRAG